MSVMFFTGFPGFLGSELLPRVLERAPGCRAVCLCQSKFIEPAQIRLNDMQMAHPSLSGRIDLAVGDIAEPGLGLENHHRLQRNTTEIFHLAAIYDLSVPREVGMRINVQGTQNVLDFAEEAPALRRLHYVSTCYVSGRHPGLFTENDLEKGQTFNNFYEETKYLAEVEVRARMRAGLPSTIYRPAIVVGDSRTGATQKYDGPYFVIRWLLRQRFIAIMPVVLGSAQTRVNLVPRDYVVDAILHLSRLDVSLGKVYQLADPQPLTVGQLIDVIADATQRIVVRVPCPMKLATFAVDQVPGVYRLMQIPSAAIHYFAHPTQYDCANTVADLEGSGVTLPPIASYVDRMVDYVRSHPDLGSGPMA